MADLSSSYRRKLDALGIDSEDEDLDYNISKSKENMKGVSEILKNDEYYNKNDLSVPKSEFLEHKSKNIARQLSGTTDF